VTDATALVGRVVDAHNAHDDRALAACYARGATVQFAGWPEPIDAGAWVSAQATIRESFPDLRFRVRATGTGPGTALVELTMTGTNAGPLHLSDTDRLVLRTDARSLPATGREMSIDGVVVLEVSDGLVTAERHHWADVTSLVQLGLVVPRRPVPETAAAAG
jgi:SnoaL-like domain